MSLTHGVGLAYVSRPTRGVNGTPGPGFTVRSGLLGVCEREILRLALKRSLAVRAASSPVPDSREKIRSSMHFSEKWLAFERDVVSTRPLISAVVDEVRVAHCCTSESLQNLYPAPE